MSTSNPHSPSPVRIPFWVQCLAWVLGLVACVAGMINVVAEWDPGLATIQFFYLVVAPIAWMIDNRRSAAGTTETPEAKTKRRAWFLAILVGFTSWTTCYLVGREMVDLPPAYHDEYSYLFQARTLLSGTFSLPSHPSQAELFDQMHVLNEGRMASRYYPGTGLWLAPFVAIGHPYRAQWLASALASVFVFWTGFELGRLRVAIVSGFACALSPGIALFSNLLLAHQATLLGLSFFVWAFVKWQRMRSIREAFFAGCGLSFAMLCRPATAASFAFPFGLAFLLWLCLAREQGIALQWSRRLKVLISIGLPIVAGWVTMMAYNQQVTGDWRTSSYQLYTDLYTPKHVYGFNNVDRGEQKQGPKVIQSYDRWAQNLTPEMAVQNATTRWLASWLWTFDLLPLLLSTVVVVASLHRIDRRWLAIVLAIISQHAFHVPYWYVGIMGWHYVFETALAWCLVLGLATDLLLSDWGIRRRWVLPPWWAILLIVSLIGAYVPPGLLMSGSSKFSRVSRGIGAIRHPRRQYAEFNEWLQSQVTLLPAIVLMDQDPDNQHVDYVVNTPGLNDSILRARYRRGKTDIDGVKKAFPDRHVYLCQPDRRMIQLADADR